MLKFRTAIILICLANPMRLCAQQPAEHAYKYSNYFDLAVSASTREFSAAWSWSHLHSIDRRIPGLKVGYGIRLTSFVAANKYYTTAPAKYTSPVQNVGTIFSNTILANIDTLTTATTSSNSLNIALYLAYQISTKFEIGLNIDAVGFSFGKEKTFDIISSSFDPNQVPVQKASPTRFNLLLTSDNDIGSLNSEFYVRYWLTKRLGLRAGYTFLFSEYRTNQALSFDHGRIVNDRYRYKAGMILFAITFKPFNLN